MTHRERHTLGYKLQEGRPAVGIDVSQTISRVPDSAVVESVDKDENVMAFPTISASSLSMR